MTDLLRTGLRASALVSRASLLAFPLVAALALGGCAVDPGNADERGASESAYETEDDSDPPYEFLNYSAVSVPNASTLIVKLRDPSVLPSAGFDSVVFEAVFPDGRRTRGQLSLSSVSGGALTYTGDLGAVYRPLVQLTHLVGSGASIFAIWFNPTGKDGRKPWRICGIRCSEELEARLLQFLASRSSTTPVKVPAKGKFGILP